MERKYNGSHSESRDNDSPVSQHIGLRLGLGEDKQTTVGHTNGPQDVAKSLEGHFPIPWIHGLMDPNEAQHGRYMLDRSGGKAPSHTMAPGSFVQLPQSYTINPEGNMYNRGVGPNTMLSLDSATLYNFDNFVKPDSEATTNEQNEVNESIKNLIKGEKAVECISDANPENIYTGYQSSSIPDNQVQKGLYCGFCQKYAKNFEELQTHVFMDHPDQTSYSFIGESSNLAAALPICPSCKIELRKINVYDQEYRIEGVQEDEQSINLAQGSDIFMICDQCGKEYTLCLAANPPTINPPSEPVKHHFCVHCGKGYKHNRDLKKHLKTQHGIDDNTTKTSYKSQNNTGDSSTGVNADSQPQPHKMVCQTCKKTFRGPFELRRHILTVHENRRPYKCSHCTKLFRDAYELKRHSVSHQRTHFQTMSTGRLPSDPILAAEMLQLSNIDANSEGIGTPGVSQVVGPTIVRDTYAGQLPPNYPSQNANVDYFCRACEKNFRGANEFKRHYTVVHEKKYRYKCIHCGKLWRDQYDLKRHCRRSHFIDREIDRAFIKKCMIEPSSQQNEINPASQPTPVPNVGNYENSPHMTLTLNHEAAVAIFGITADGTMRGGNNNIDNPYALGHNHISMVSSPNHSIFQNLPSMTSATMMYHSSTDPSSNIVEHVNQPQSNDDITEEIKNAVNWSNFESDIQQAKKPDYS